MFQLPKNASDLLELVKSTEQDWEPRNRRFREEQFLWEIHRRPPPPGVQYERRELITSNRVVVAILDALGQLLSAPPEYEVGRMTADDLARCQRVENWLRSQRGAWRERHQRQGQNALDVDELQDILLRGWLCALCLWDPQAASGSINNPRDYSGLAHPFRMLKVDPLDVYPAFTADGPPDWTSLTRHYPVSQIKALWPRKWWDEAAKTVLDGKPDRETVCVRQLFTESESAAMLGDSGTGWLRRPTRHGYPRSPLVMVTAYGASWRHGSTPPPSETGPSLDGADYYARYGVDAYGGDTHWQRYVGRSLVSPIIQQVRDEEDVRSMARNVGARMAYPPGADFTDNPKDAPPLPRAIGADGHYERNDNVEYYVPHPAALQGLQGVGVQVAQDIAAALPAASPVGAPSGYAGVAAMQAGGQRLGPFIAAVQGYHLQIAKLQLGIFSEFGTVSPVIEEIPGIGRVLGEPLRKEEALGMDLLVEVRYLAVSAPERMARVNAAILLRRDGLVDDDTLRGEVLQFSNPAAIARKVRRQRAETFPAFQQADDLYELAEEEERQALQQQVPSEEGLRHWRRAQLARAMAQKIEQEFLISMTSPKVPQPGVNQPPAPALGPGLGNAMFPDEMAQGAGFAPNETAVGPLQVGAAPQLV